MYKALIYRLVVGMAALTTWPLGADATPSTEIAQKAWIDCLRRAAAELDDGKSDPLTIALGMQPACSGQLRRVEQAFGSGLPYENYRYLVAKIERSAIEVSVTVVLQGREGGD